jgi:putative FmdB family regulatory protein
MPIYAYKCHKCGHDFEKLTSLSKRDAPVKCEKCGAEKVNRSGASFAVSIGSSGASSSCGGGNGFS